MVLEHELEDGLKKNGGRVRGVSSGEECEVEVGVVDWASLDDFLGRGVWNGESRRGVGGLRVKQERRGFQSGWYRDGIVGVGLTDPFPCSL